MAAIFKYWFKKADDNNGNNNYQFKNVLLVPVFMCSMYFVFFVNISKLKNAVTPVLNDQPWDPNIYAVVDKSSLYRIFKMGRKNGGFVDKWSLFRDGRWLKFDCTLNIRKMK